MVYMYVDTRHGVQLRRNHKLDFKVLTQLGWIFSTSIENTFFIGDLSVAIKKDANELFVVSNVCLHKGTKIHT